MIIKILPHFEFAYHPLDDERRAALQQTSIPPPVDAVATLGWKATYVEIRQQYGYWIYLAPEDDLNETYTLLAQQFLHWYAREQEETFKLTEGVIPPAGDRKLLK